MEEAQGQTARGKAGGVEQRWRWNPGLVRKTIIQNSRSFLISSLILISPLTKPEAKASPWPPGGWVVEEALAHPAAGGIFSSLLHFCAEEENIILCPREKERLLKWNTLPHVEETPEG